MVKFHKSKFFFANHVFDPVFSTYDNLAGCIQQCSPSDAWQQAADDVHNNCLAQLDDAIDGFQEQCYKPDLDSAESTCQRECEDNGGGGVGISAVASSAGSGSSGSYCRWVRCVLVVFDVL